MPQYLGQLLPSVFPFHLQLDDQLHLTALGPSARKVLPDVELGSALPDVFNLISPRGELNRERVCRRLKGTFLCELKGSPFRLRGQFVQLPDAQGFIYLCSPWLEDPEILSQFNLKESDFAPHETSIEHLYLTYARDQQLDELNQLNQQLHETIAESKRLADVEAALTRDLQVAADLRILISHNRLASVSIDAPALEPLRSSLVAGQTVEACPDWLADALHARPAAEGTAPVASLLSVVVCDERRSLDLRMSQVGEQEFIVLGRDVTDERAEHVLLLRTLEQAMEAVVMVDDNGQVIFFNQSAQDLFEYSRREVIGQSVAMLQSDRDEEVFLADDPRQNRRGEARLNKKDGSKMLCGYSVSRVRLGRNAVVTAFIQDITLQREAEARITFQANHDGLTGLANRRYFQERLRGLFAGTLQSKIAVVMVDMDDFKTINDLLGHGSGDEFLKTTADRISRAIRDTDLACRLGGDEFALILKDIHSQADADRIMRRVMQELRQPVTVDNVQWTPTASVGVALGAGHVDAGDLLRNADLAMYEAKALGKGRVYYYTENLSRRALGHIEMKKRLEEGLRNGEIEAHFQPIVDLATGRPVAFEALARWAPRDGPPVSPVEFIPVAEKSDLILEIEEQIVDQAIVAVKNMRSRHPDFAKLWVDVNISPRHFVQSGFTELIQTKLDRYAVPAEAITLELTESILLNDSDAVRAQFDGLRARGMRIALDDFGTGYSSLSYLDRYHFDMIKIDRSFVDEIATTDIRRRLVEIMLAVGRVMEAEVVAEGVERVADERTLQSMQCGLAQGYLYSKPLPLSELEIYLDGFSSDARQDVVGE